MKSIYLSVSVKEAKSYEYNYTSAGDGGGHRGIKPSGGEMPRRYDSQEYK